MRVYVCKELERYYVFSLVPNDLTKGDGYANSGVYLVDKNTGEYKIAHFTFVI